MKRTFNLRGAVRGRLSLAFSQSVVSAFAMYLHSFIIARTSLRAHLQYEHIRNRCLPNTLVRCGECSPLDCKASVVANTAGYSAGPLVLVENGRDVHKSTEMNSCPDGYKIWSPRNKNDWEIVWRAMKQSLAHYPRKPNLVIDVTNPKEDAGKESASDWQTTDGSDWWLGGTNYAKHGHSTANCYMKITDADPSDVQIEGNDCDFHSTDYFCQPENGTQRTRTCNL